VEKKGRIVEKRMPWEEERIKIQKEGK